ncbi:MAG: YfiR family protein [Actinobacteria bacterium]|nr:YfiR family protein [Actinomycetota bacterium]
MKIYCNREILSALSWVSFPKTKNEILSVAEISKDISEASIICLNKIEDKVYFSIDEICENIKIVCSLELRDALKKIKFPATKSQIIKKFKNKNYSLLVIKSIEELSENQVFNNIDDICL